MTSTPGVASADVLRVMAHELRQPLSTIESIAYYLTLILPKDDEKIHQQLERIQRLVEQSNWIVTSAQQLAGPVEASCAPVRIEALIREILSERSVLGENPLIEIGGELPPVNVDAALARAMIDNLLTLFRTISRPALPATVSVRNEADGVAVELSTEAAGYKSEASLGPGATLGLESARRIAAAHGGSLDLKIDPENGVRLRVVLR